MITERLEAVSQLLVAGECFLHTGTVCVVTRRARDGSWVDLVVTDQSLSREWRKRQPLTPGFLAGVHW